MAENDFAILNHEPILFPRSFLRFLYGKFFICWALTSMSTKLKIALPNPINVFLDSFVTEIYCDIEQIWRINLNEQSPSEHSGLIVCCAGAFSPFCKFKKNFNYISVLTIIINQISV